MPRPDRHREPLIIAAASQLRRHGYAGAFTAEILQAAGATNGSLYHHFPGGKDELAQAAIGAAADRVQRQLRHALGEAPDVATALTGWVQALIAGLERHPLDGCPVAPVAVETATLSPALRAATADAFKRWTQVLADALEPQLSRPAALARARVLLSLIEGALLLDRAAGTTDHLRAITTALPTLLAPS